MIVVDTNVVSESDKPKPDQNVVRWFSRQNATELYVTVTTIAEIAFGAERIFVRSSSVRYWDALNVLIKSTFPDRILDFTVLAALENGRVRAKREAAGKPIDLHDSQIAAICLVHGATLATRNVRDFDGLGLKLVNPFEA